MTLLLIGDRAPAVWDVHEAALTMSQPAAGYDARPRAGNRR